MPIEETARAMHDLFKEGVIRAIGVSNYSPEQMDRFMSVSELHTVQPPYNLFERQIERDVLPYSREKNLSVFTYGSLCRGLLTGQRNRNEVHRRRSPPVRSEISAAALRAISECGSATG